jgi:5-methylcytosine-specific restriction endonuclease McrA
VKEDSTSDFMELCSRIERTPSKLIDYCIENGCKLNPGNHSSQLHRHKGVLEHLYYNEGLNKKEIAERLNVTDSTVIRWMDRHGIESKSGSFEKSKAELYKNIGEECVLCGCEEEIEAHHIIEKQHFDSKRKANSTANLVPLCVECHRKQHSRTPRDLFFMATQQVSRRW